ncbi:hypothetical protein [Ralstonia pseudosolanacearum]|uniref:hypothetical protein n=1 Tax=Ralstonia pseudosolanacearum TaxID=1310165 RepID=UPI001C75EA23|nr:hypothetical protein [Ralstonia sp. RS642]QWQ13362.1 hypothetical protein KN198_07990 [Ralstonia solanacearum]UZF26539.1 hypothetical protein LGV80_08510 [Ralstonia sp. RS642]
MTSIEHRTTAASCALTKMRHEVAALEAKWGLSRRADYMAFLWKDAINRMTTEQKRVEFDALCWEWWARTRDTDTCKHDWDALFGMLHPLYVWWSEEDCARFEAWRQRRAQERGEAFPPTVPTTCDALREEYDAYRDERPRHPALAALEEWRHPISELRLSADLITARSQLRTLEEAEARSA